MRSRLTLGYRGRARPRCGNRYTNVRITTLIKAYIEGIEVVSELRTMAHECFRFCIQADFRERKVFTNASQPKYERTPSVFYQASNEPFITNWVPNSGDGQSIRRNFQIPLYNFVTDLWELSADPPTSQYHREEL